MINYLKSKANFFNILLNALPDQIAVINSHGEIVYVNQSWINFGNENGMPSNYQWKGANYLTVCNSGFDADGAPVCLTTSGIFDVILNNKESYQAEYPCHSPKKKRWFRMHVASLNGLEGSLFIVTHTDITERKLIEIKMQRLSMSDSLTGLANRRCLNDFLEAQWKRSLRSKKPLSILMIDIDFFKQYNDAFGHIKGDECLKLVSHVIEKFARRPDDLAARFGGEEFVLVLGETEQTDAMRFAKTMCHKIAALNIPNVNNKTVTVSIGVSTMLPNSKRDNTSLLNHADKALYQAKKNGRNRVEFFVEAKKSNMPLAKNQAA